MSGENPKHDSPLTGTTVDGYRIDRKIGSGGMAEVYAATQLALEREVAIKVVKPEVTYLPAGVARFEREARTASRLRHPALLGVFDFGRLPDCRPYLVMPLLEGRSMREALREDGPWDPGRLHATLAGAADALDSMHGEGLVHRDVKPDNLFLTRSKDGAEHAVVMDFGLATLLESDAQLTQSDILLGTPAYLPPEAAHEGARDTGTDVYALSVVLYEMLCGRPPFRDRDVVRLMARRLVSDAPAPSSFRRDLDRRLDGFFARALSRAPAERFTSCRALLEAFGRLAHADPEPLADDTPSAVATRRPSAPPPRSRSRILAGSMALAGLAALFWFARPVPTRVPQAQGESPSTAPPPPAPPASPTPLLARVQSEDTGPQSPPDAGVAASARTSRRATSVPMEEPTRPVEEPAEAQAPAAPPDVSALLDTARGLLLRGRAVDARRTYRRAAGLDPENADAWLGVGLAEEALEDHAGARRALERAARVASTPAKRAAIRARIARLP